MTEAKAKDDSGIRIPKAQAELAQPASTPGTESVGQTARHSAQSSEFTRSISALTRTASAPWMSSVSKLAENAVRSSLLSVGDQLTKGYKGAFDTAGVVSKLMPTFQTDVLTRFALGGIRSDFNPATEMLRTFAVNNSDISGITAGIFKQTMRQSDFGASRAMLFQNITTQAFPATTVRGFLALVQPKFGVASLMPKVFNTAGLFDYSGFQAMTAALSRPHEGVASGVFDGAASVLIKLSEQQRVAAVSVLNNAATNQRLDTSSVEFQQLPQSVRKVFYRLFTVLRNIKPENRTAIVTFLVGVVISAGLWQFTNIQQSRRDHIIDTRYELDVKERHEFEQQQLQMQQQMVDELRSINERVSKIQTCVPAQ